MEVDTNSPKGFEPFEQLDVCSNVIVGGGSIIGIKDFAPIRIGKGKEYPLVWLYVYMRGEWIPVLKANKSRSPELLVTTNSALHQVVVKSAKTIIVECRMNNEESCSVNRLDLRPLGIDLWGVDDSLFVRNARFSGNFFHNGKYLIGSSV